MESQEKTTVEMTAEEKAAWEASKKRAVKREQRKQLQELVDAEMGVAVSALMDCSNLLKTVKGKIFANFDTIMKLRRELNEDDNPESDEQFSFTFTSSDGLQRLRIGYNMNDNYLMQVEDGIKKVREYLQSLAKDEASGRLVDAVMSLLSRDQKGNLKASRVLKLSKMAEDSGNETFKEGMAIIRDAYSPTPGKTYIRCQVKTTKTADDGTESQEWTDVGLSMAEV